MKICILGTGYVGLVSGTCFSDLGNNVICVDKNLDKIEKLKNELEDFKSMAEKSKNLYDEVLDKTTKSIEKFIEKAETKQEKNIQ